MFLARLAHRASAAAELQSYEHIIRQMLKCVLDLLNFSSDHSLTTMPKTKVSNSKSSHQYQKVLHSSRLQRKIGYSFFPAKDASKRKSAITIFYPLAATSLLVDANAESGSVDNYHASVLCVDRPGVAQTDALPRHTTSVERIERHADDVLEVFQRHAIEEVYLLAACLGHPYAVQVARRIISCEQSNIVLKGLTLVAPFVSPACPDAWRVARLGAAVPSFVLGAATSLSWVGSISMPAFLTPKRLANLISPKEQEDFGWSSSEDDFARAVRLALEMNKLSRHAQGVEARLGADPSWITICDYFARERQNAMGFPIAIRACAEDKVTPIASVLWLANRCFGGEEIVCVDDRVHSHEVMTMFGGPPGRPILMHEIAREWGLLLE